MVYDPRIRAGIFAGESGGDYNALFGYQNRPNGRFSNVNLTSMPISDVLAFTNPSGPYAQYVKGEVGRVATPVGAYQVVGSTLRDAVNALGIDPSTPFNQQTQDRIGQWILENQGTGAWEGYRPGSQPSTQSSTFGSNKMPMTPQQPQGILGSLGIQRQDPAATDQTALPFYQRDRFKDTMGNLAMAFNELRMNPSQAIPQVVQGNRERRQSAMLNNRTIEWLRTQPNGEAYIQMIESGANPAQVIQALLSGRGGENVVVGNSIINRQTGEVVYTSPESADPSSTIAKLAMDLKNGYITQEQYDLAVANMAPSGTAVEVGPDGTVRFVQGAGVKLTEGQGRATGFYGRASASDKILSDLERQGTDLYNAIVSNVPVAGNYLISEEFQQYSQAKRDFINAILRQESGAVIGPQEFANAEQQYFPQPGDGTQVVEQKRRNRLTAIEGLRVASGPGASAIGGAERQSQVEPSDQFTITGRVGE